MKREIADRGVDFCLEQARAAGAGMLDISFFGGEPLLEPDMLCHIADRLAAEAPAGLRLNFRLSTNGTLLTEKRVEMLKKRNIFVSISLDGPPELHDCQRPLAGGEGSWRSIEAGIRRLLDWNPLANVTCVITPDTAAQVDTSVPWIYKLGFRFITTALNYRADWTKADIARLKKSYARLGKWYEKRMLAGEHFYLSCFDDRIQTRTKPPLGANERCNIGYKQFSIAPDGELYPCIQFVTTEKIPQFRIGHVETGFDEQARHGLKCSAGGGKEACGTCALENRCNNWCACVNYQSTGSISQVSPVVCHHEQALLEVADKVGNRLWKKGNKTFAQKQYDPLYEIISQSEILNSRP